MTPEVFEAAFQRIRAQMARVVTQLKAQKKSLLARQAALV